MKNLSGLEKLCNLWSLAEVLVDVWKKFCGNGGGFCAICGFWFSILRSWIGVVGVLVQDTILILIFFI